MKKRVFCVLFALLISISALAAAEKSGCCACCTSADTASSDDASTESARTVRPSKYDVEGFTLEVDQYDFKFFLPSTFAADKDYPESYRSIYSGFYPHVDIESDPRMASFPVDAFYTDREELRHSLDVYAVYNPEYEVIQMDECLGLMRYWQSTYSSSTYFVNINVTNRKNICDVTVVVDSLDEALELAYAIIDHAVAKEIPLEELEHAE